MLNAMFKGSNNNLIKSHNLQVVLLSLLHDLRRVVARALSILLDLMNVAEDRERTRILRERERAAHPAPRVGGPVSVSAVRLCGGRRVVGQGSAVQHV